MTQVSQPADGWLREQSARVDRALSALAQRQNGSTLAAAMAYAAAGGGKRLRPALLLGAYKAVKQEEPADAVVGLGCAIELIHTYSLIHDDLPCMDDDDLRRGRPTLHRVFDEQTAMFAGAALIPLAFRVLVDSAAAAALGPDLTLRLTRELARAAGGAGMVGGQVLDLESEGQAISIEDLEFLHRAKTGALVTAAVRIGALAAGTAPDQLRALTTFGRCVGLAFQIADDVLDETAPSATLGKTAGKDRAVAKATFPALLGLEQASQRARAEVVEAMAALQDAALASDELRALARFAIERKH